MELTHPSFELRDPRTKQVLFTGFAILPEGMPLILEHDNFYFMAKEIQVVTKEPVEIWNKVLELCTAEGEHVAFVNIGLHQTLDAGIPSWRLGFQVADNLEVLDSIGIRNE